MTMMTALGTCDADRSPRPVREAVPLTWQEVGS